MKCSKCGHVARDIKGMGKHYRQRHKRSAGGKRRGSRKSRGGGGGSRHTMGTGGHRYMTYYFHD